MSLRFSFGSRWAVAASVLACAALAAPAAASADYSTSVLADGPLTYYRLNEAAGSGVAADASPNHVDGTASNATFGFTPAPFSGAVSAVSFSGNGSISASLAAQARTAELWVRPTKKNSQMSLVTLGDPAADGWSVGIGARHKLVFTTGNKTISSRLPVGTSRWTMVDVTWTATQVSFALNGGQTQYKTFTLPVAAPGPASDTGLVVGNGPLGGVQGAIDEVALYPLALTRAQIGGHLTATGLPVNTVAPVIGGVPRVGDTISVTTPGTWTGGTSGSSYQWQMCDPVSGDCSDISGATGTSLLLDSSELGQQIQVVESESNPVGSSSVSSNQTAPVVDVSPAGGPVNVNLPTIAGSALVGQTLTADPGTWDPASGLTFGYQWQRCDVDGANCSPIAGATSQTYLLGANDLGNTVDVVVTASDGTHTSDPAESDTTDVIAAPSSGGNNPGGGTSGTTAGSSTVAAAGGVLGTQTVCPARVAKLPKRLTRRHRGFGKVSVRFRRASGRTALKAVLGVPQNSVRTIDVRIGSKRVKLVKRLRRSPLTVAIPRARLKPGATQTLKITVTPKDGKRFSLKVRIRTAACS
jgi:concanavalin A-like lectin/glucanase superfamily protein